MKHLARIIPLLLMLLVLWPVSPGTAHAQPGPPCLTFPETGKTACGAFLAYWQQHGGLAQQGFPISGEFWERSDMDGTTYLVQYFERAVFEIHPENKPPYDMLLSLLGTKQLKQKWPQGAPDTDPNLMTGQTRTFPETGKHVSGIFLDYWRKNGGLAQQGYPITNPLLESATRTSPPYVVQYFERAVFELHNDNSGKLIVLLSRLGAAEFALKYPNGEASPTPAPGSEVWATLRARPLALPTISAGSACPITPTRQANPEFGQALGTGPVYAVGFGTDSTYHFAGTNQEGGWLYLKVLWIVDPAYKGQTLVRGRQIDGPGKLRFERGPDPATELDLAQESALASPGTWSNWPSYTRLKGPGCYAYQIDGTDFSKVLVFRAQP